MAAELAIAGVQELLEATSAAHLAYTAKDGTPRVVPVGFFWTGEQFVISTADTAPRVGALLARPKSRLPSTAAAEFERDCRQLYDRMARVAITPTWMRFYDFGGSRLPQFLTELVNRNLR